MLQSSILRGRYSDSTASSQLPEHCDSVTHLSVHPCLDNLADHNFCFLNIRLLDTLWSFHCIKKVFTINQFQPALTCHQHYRSEDWQPPAGHSYSTAQYSTVQYSTVQSSLGTCLELGGRGWGWLEPPAGLSPQLLRGRGQERSHSALVMAHTASTSAA